MKIDSAWFINTIERSHHGSMRRFAIAFGIDHGNMSRMLSGKRPMRMREAEKIARLLEVDLSDVLAHAGLRLEDPQALIDALEYYAKGSDPRRARAALAAWRK